MLIQTLKSINKGQLFYVILFFPSMFKSWREEGQKSFETCYLLYEMDEEKAIICIQAALTTKQFMSHLFCKHILK